MKHVFSTIAILILVLVASNALQAKGVVKTTDVYTIYTSEVATPNNTFDKMWTIEYSTADKYISVLKRTIDNGEEYIVRNKFFEVRYTNTVKGFSAKMIKKADATVSDVINQLIINPEQLKQQSLLSSKQLSEEKALAYIADFVPLLLNENYKLLLN